MRITWAKIIGQSPDFNLEARIFNGICFFSCIGTLFGAVSNMSAGAVQIGLIYTALVCCMALCYYIVRIKLMFNSAIVLYMVTINVLNIANFKYNAGINGPGLLIFTLTNFLTFSIIPKKYYVFWVLFNISLVVSLLLWQYNYPNAINNSVSVTERFVRLGAAYLLALCFLLVITRYIRKSYDTERALVEKHAAELETANETKNKLFSILAHDLQSPLAAIQNYLEILSELQLNQEERQLFEKSLLESTINTKQMLTNLLSWSKAQMDGVTIKLVPIDLKEILMDIFKTYKPIAAEKKVRIAARLNAGILISADKDMFQLIIRNLIDNAIKFTNPGDQITISDEITGGDCSIIIKDNGIGIPVERQGSIFSLKAASTYGTKNEKGVGLGLVLCKEYTELQNGKIAFESTPGVGTTFYVSFKLLENVKNNKTAEPEALTSSIS